MKLDKLISLLNPTEVLNGENLSNIEVQDISYNSKTTKAGDIFVCLVGEKTDGHKYAKMAQDAGAVAILAMPKSNHTRRLAAKAADKVEDVAWKMTSKITDELDL